MALHGLLGHFSEERTMKDRMLSWAVMDIRAERIRRFLMSAISGEDEETDAFRGRWQGNSHRREPMGMELYYRAEKNASLRERVLEEGERVVSDDHHAWRIRPLMTDTDASDLAKDWKNAAEMTAGLIEISLGNGIMKGKSGNFEKTMKGLMEGTSEHYGREPENAFFHVRSEERGDHDYHELLRMLKKHAAKMKEEDVPDPVFYQYGLELYEDMPLVEPLEEAESMTLGTIAVAVDTSGSCREGLPQFLRETGALLEQLTEDVEVKRLRYLECDAQVQAEELYEENEICEALSNQHEYRGGGGTDFRPVFERLKEYREQGDDIDCLLYYTDGIGDYPKEAPDYPCFFVLWGDEAADARLPEWVIPVYL